jgi:AcrR family transcriptional regulator
MKKAVAKHKTKRPVGRPPKSEVGANEVREKILEAAEHVFSEKGIHGAGLREIAKRSRHSLAIVTYYFKTKENLVLEVYDRQFHSRRLAMNTTQDESDHKATLQSLENMFREALSWYGTEAGLRSYRLQLSVKMEGSATLDARSKDYWTKTTSTVSGMMKQINPSLSEAEALERTVILLLLVRARTELYWGYGTPSGQSRDSELAMVQTYEGWLFKHFLPMLVGQAKP